MHKIPDHVQDRLASVAAGVMTAIFVAAVAAPLAIVASMIQAVAS